MMPFFAFGLLLFIYSALAWHYGPHMGDDGFIFYRYAENLLAGHGPLWNPGETAVEGYSSPLWLGLLAFWGLLGVPVPMAGKVMGLSFGFLSLLSIIRLLRVLGRNSVSVWLSIGASMTVGLHYWSPAGLETTLYLLIWIWALIALDRPNAIWTVALLGVARPEGPMLVLVWCLADGFLSRRFNWMRCLYLLAPAMLWLGFRLYYYGDWLPNTYYAKTGGDLLQQLSAGFQYALIPVVAWALCVVTAGIRRDRFSLTLLFMVGIHLAIVVGGGGDWMVRERMLLPSILVLWGFVHWKTRLEKILAAGTVYCLILSWPSMEVIKKIAQGEQLSIVEYQEGSLVSESEKLAQHIQNVSPPGSTIAINHAGAVPYFLSEHQFIDMTGLNDRHISRVKGGLHQKYDSDYILSKRPDGIVLNTRTRPDQGQLALNYWMGEIDLAQNPEFQANYRPLLIAGDDENPVLFVSRLARGGSKAFMVYFVRINP